MTIGALLDKVREYHPKADTDNIHRAYEFAREKHEGQTRASGEPYITHPLAVADIVADLRLDEDSIVAALLHDTVEDTPANIEEIRAEFGESISDIVDGLTTLSSVHFRSQKHSQAENFRKMLVAMARDIRVLMVKLADRVHNMRTLQHMPRPIRIKIASETKEIYAPLANRLGIAWIKTELEDLSFRFLYEEEYQELRSLVSKKKRERDVYTGHVERELRAAVDERGYTDAQVYGRAKHFFSIYRKMQRQGIDFDQVYDLIAFRIIVDKVSQCYEVLGIVHTIWKPIPGRFKDYIALPKANGYRSLHTAVIGPYGEKLEVQIRTREMHRVAEQGIAAHWKYKEADSSISGRDEENFAWLKQLVKWQQDLEDPSEFIDTVKVDLFSEEVYVFTPGGDLKVLPRGATCVDFAYSVHTEVGHTCSGAKVNGRMVPLSTELRNGDRVEILTNPKNKPSRDWLKFVASSSARTKIRSHIRQEQRATSREIGRGMLERELRKQGKSFDKLFKSGELARVARELKCHTVDDLCVQVGFYKTPPEDVIARLFPVETPAAPELPTLPDVAPTPLRTRRGRSPVVIAGIEDMMVRFARCCKPVPGDDVVGFVTRGRGLTVHLRSCPFAQSQPRERILDVDWGHDDERQYSVRIRVSTADRKGILVALTDVISRHGVNITQAMCHTSEEGRADNTFTLSVNDLSQLSDVLRALERLPGVFAVERLRG